MNVYTSPSGGSHEFDNPLQELESRYPALDDLNTRLGEIYGVRDQIYLDGRYDRIRLFEQGAADLFDALRREPSLEACEQITARVVSRIFCIARGVPGVSISESMMRKFPLEGCAYCGNSQCTCGATRAEVRLAEQPNEVQKSWGLWEWQQHLNMLYGKPNRAKGIWFACARLAVETGELKAEEDKVSASTIDEIRRGYGLELADTMAWTMAIANMLGVNLHRAVLKQYGHGCGICGDIPCRCSRHNFQQTKFG